MDIMGRSYVLITSGSYMVKTTLHNFELLGVSSASHCKCDIEK